MDVLAGAHRDEDVVAYQRLLYRHRIVAVAALDRADLDVLHADRDYDTIARYTGLRVVAP